MKKLTIVSLLLFLPLLATALRAQQVAIKTNAFYLATTTPNLGVEIALGPKLTLDVRGAYNPWKFGNKESNKKIQHWIVSPELRFWPYEKFDGHFLGLNPMFLSYNAGGVNVPLAPFGDMKNNRYEGYGTGMGFSYGYQFFLGNHWNLELSAGVGYVYFNYERYECRRCGNFLERTHKHWVGPTNLGLTFVYLFRSKKY